jgi:proline iminopeptidase
MRDRYPPIEPYVADHLDVGDGHRLYWEICGNPGGIPALVLHGGPGTGCGPGIRRYFDPARYRIVLFDQRGCGRSLPFAGEPIADLSANTTAHLLADIERLRAHLDIERWLLFGGSWGCVLGLLYAERHPERVSGIVMMGLATGRRAETDLLTRGVGPLFPEAWRAFRDHVTASEQDGDLPAAYARLLADPDPAMHQPAADAWCRWEDALQPGVPGILDEESPEWRLAFARLVTHYWSHASWLEPDQVLRDAARLGGIKGTLVQGTLDLGNLIGTPWLLAAAWPDATLRLVDAGHETRSAAMVDALVSATDAFADELLGVQGGAGGVRG